MHHYEQNNGIVIIDGTTKRLPMLTAWKNSSSVYWVKPEYLASEMYFKVGSADGKSWAANISMFCHARRGLFRAYVPGLHFAGGRYETKYQIVTIDEEGCEHVSGEGVIRVFDSSIGEYAPFHVVARAGWPDGNVREITITEDETGAAIFTVGGIVEGEAPQGEIYAHENSSGQFHLVTTFIDEVGEPMLSVSENPVNGGFDQFVADGSGFYRRIECATDESGSTTLQTGDKIQ